MLVKNSKKEDNFINDLIEVIKEINTENIQSKEVLDQIIQSLASATERIYSKVVNITKHSKKW